MFFENGEVLANSQVSSFFPWQEKLVVPLIATPNGDMQCEDRVTKKKGKKLSYRQQK